MIILGICGIIAEFNPLHNGHKYLIEQAKADGNTVVTVISGNFVQRGDTAIVSKFVRAQMALECGADVVLELPTPWAMSTAQNFAFGAVSQLLAFGIDSLYFGSESGNIDELKSVSNLLLSEEYNKRIADEISSGDTFAKKRSEIISELLGYNSSVLYNPNDTLAVEYISAARRLGADINFVPIKRKGAGHNDDSARLEFSNATLIRENVHLGDFNANKSFMPSVCFDLMMNSPISDISRIDKAIVAKLKLMSKQHFSSLPDISEGIDNLLYNKVRECFDYTELLNALKSRRYTLARIRRLVLSAFLEIDSKYFGVEPPYVRLLGFNKDTVKFDFDNARKPIISKVSQIQKLNDFSKELFAKENQINEIYALTFDSPDRFLNESKEKLIIK